MEKRPVQAKIAHGAASVMAFLAAILAMGLCIGCVTTPQRQDALERSAISASSPGFSPTGEESKRRMEFSLIFGAREAVQSWSIEIASGSVIVGKLFGVGPELPEKVYWDGRSERDDIWPEGEYTAMFVVDYGTAYNPSPVSWCAFKLVTSGPSLSLSAEPSVLKPAGAAMEEPTKIRIDASSRFSKPSSWSVSILDSEGRELRRFEGEGEPGTVPWDGTLDKGLLALPDTRYVARARVLDEYGNDGEEELAIDVGPSPEAPQKSSLSAGRNGFSPTGEAATRTMPFALQFGNPEAIRTWTMRILFGYVRIKEIEGTGESLPTTVTWDGLVESGQSWPEGEYRAVLVVDYGDYYQQAVAESETFRLVSSQPMVKIDADPAVFTPAGRAMAEPITFGVTASSRLASLSEWSLDCIDQRGEVVMGFKGKGAPGGGIWDGKTMAGTFVEPSKTYTARARVRDEFGNVGESTLAIMVNAQPDAPESSSIAADSSGFSPTGESSTRTMGIAVKIGSREALRSWAVEIVTDGVAIKRYSGTNANPPARLTWDGKSETGASWPEGEYYPVLSVDYGQSFNPVRIAGKKFALVSSQPTVRLETSPSSFTPDAKGMAEPVKISLESRSRLAQVASWTIDLIGSRGETVRSFSGVGGSGHPEWDGTDASGMWLEPGSSFTARARARDAYGNTGEASIAIAVQSLLDAPEQSMIDTEAKGFSPMSSRSGGRIGFSILIGSAKAMRSWKIEIGDSGGVRRSFAGAAGEAPDSISWDGKDADGEIVPEGSYSATLYVDYGRANKPVMTRSKAFLVATTPPSLRLSASPDSFVPAERGVTAPVAIVLDAQPSLGAIESWSLEISDPQGRAVRSFERRWPENQAIWDGMTSAGAPVEPATRYSARASVVDEYGNTGSASLVVPVKEIPSAPETSFIVPRSAGFSPLGTGKPRTIDFVIRAGNAAQMRSWKVTIAHSERGAQRVFAGDPASLAPTLAWDGKTDSGQTAPDGNYVATLSVEYGKSYRTATAKSDTFAVQTAPPEVTVSALPARFVPKAGAFEKPVEIGVKAQARFTTIEGWSVLVLDPSGKQVASFRDAGPSGRFSWDGRTAVGGFLEPSTTYTLLAEARDSFGNIGTGRALLTVADLPSVPGDNAIGLAAKGLSPNGDGIMDSIDLLMSVANRESVRSWKISIVHADKGPQGSFAGDKSALRDRVTWFGRRDDGGEAPDGVYTAELSIDYGTVYKAAAVSSRRFVLTTTPPECTVTVNPAAVVPDEKGLLAPAQISLDGSSPLASIFSWALSVSDSSGRRLRGFEGEWPPQIVSWDGVADDGSLAEPGSSYSVEAAIRDEFGNLGSAVATIMVGGLPRATEESSVRAASKGFSPSSLGSMRIALSFGNRNLIKRWSLDIEREDQAVRVGFIGNPGSFPDTFTWNGKLQDGSVAPDGPYVARLFIDYGRVYSPTEVSSSPFLLVATPPEASIRVEPPLFSPDGDGMNETLTIRLSASSQYARVTDWSVDIIDPGKKTFASFKGAWPAAPIAWNGRNAKNELVESAEDYQIVALIKDEFGNARELKSTAIVDLLVIREGDGYRIRIASIVFKSYTADFLDVPSDQSTKNVSTIDKLADKLKKFPDYQIRIVGHAIMINWDDPVKGKAEQEKVLIPLSKARADAIKQALVARGIESSRIATEGVGASDQIVPDSDFANRWKNRRVDFFLQRKK
jgi:flagellar hook assembly protein FlgD/flagellar motor protein MotB